MIPRIIPTFQDLQDTAGEIAYSAVSTAAKFPKSVWLFGMSCLPTAFGQSCKECAREVAMGRWEQWAEYAKYRNNLRNPGISFYDICIALSPLAIIGISIVSYICYKNYAASQLKKQKLKSERDLKAKANELSLEHQKQAKLDLEAKKQAQRKLKEKVPAAEVKTTNTTPASEVRKRKHIQGKLKTTQSNGSSRNKAKRLEKLKEKNCKKEAQDAKKLSKDQKQANQLLLAKKREERKKEKVTANAPAAARTSPVSQLRQSPVPKIGEHKAKPSSNITKNPPSSQACQDYIASLQPVLAFLTTEKKQEQAGENKLNEFLTYTALLFLVPRIHLALSYIDSRDRDQSRLLIQHTTMEVEAKDIQTEAAQLNQSLQQTVVQLENPAVTVKGAMNVTQTVLSQTQPKLAEINKKDLFAENQPKLHVGLDELKQKDEKYFNWVRTKIVPMINLFSQDILNPDARIKLSPMEYRIRIFAVTKLLSFIGEYYKFARRQRYEHGVSRFFPLPPVDKKDSQTDIAQLFKSIRYGIRNKVDHLNNKHMTVTSDQKVEQLCAGVKMISNQVANLSDYKEDRFPFSFNNFKKKKSNLNPLAEPFDPEDQAKLKA